MEETFLTKALLGILVFVSWFVVGIVYFTIEFLDHLVLTPVALIFNKRDWGEHPANWLERHYRW